jgi:hypothetical protein
MQPTDKPKSAGQPRRANAGGKGKGEGKGESKGSDKDGRSVHTFVAGQLSCDVMYCAVLCYTR